MLMMEGGGSGSGKGKSGKSGGGKSGSNKGYESVQSGFIADGVQVWKDSCVRTTTTLTSEIESLYDVIGETDTPISLDVGRSNDHNITTL